MKSRTSRLTRELLSLYAQYGPEEFEAASRELREGNLTRLIAETADSLGVTAKKAVVKGVQPGRGVKSRPSKRDVLVSYLERLKASTAKADTAVAEFAEKILKRDVLETTASMMDYMALIGMPVSRRTLDRYQNIREIAEFLRSLPEAGAIERIRIAEDMRDRGSSLQRWTDIIVKPR